MRDRTPRWRPGPADTDELSLRPGPGLRGRLAGPTEWSESPETVAEALRLGLAGRGAGLPTRAEEPAERTKRERAAATVDFVGDAELFTAERPAPPVIERPEDAKPVSTTKAVLRPVERGL